MNPRSDISLFMRLEPDIPKLTHQNGLKVCSVRGDSSPRVFKSPALIDLEDKYASLLKRFAPASPWDCPIHLTTIWHFRSATKTGWKTTSPDTDNLVKTLKDCMEKVGFYRHDALVCLDC